jgi:cysteine desulfurase
MGNPIYLDNNATSHLSPNVLEAMLPYLREEFHNPSAPYRAGAAARQAVENARSKIAEAFGCRPREVIFCSGGTEADNAALCGVARAEQAKGRHIVTSAVEHPAVLETARFLETQGFEVTYSPVTADGIVDMAAFEKSLRPDTILISIMHANNETGAVQPVEAIAEAAKKRDIVFHCDAVQSAGKLPIDLSKPGPDMISISGHKLHGPKGIGALLIREGTPFSPLIRGGGQELGMRSGTENVPSVVGLAIAIGAAAFDLEAAALRTGRLRDRFEQQVKKELRDAIVNGEKIRVANTSNLTLPGVDGESVVLGMDLKGISISTGSACSTGDEMPSHVLRAMGLSPKAAQSSVRISLSRYTVEEEADTAAAALVETVRRLRAVSSI